MIGGDRAVFSALEPMFADVALPGRLPRSSTGHGAGHFVKMVHNGIEYGMMQAIAEGFAVLHDGPFDLDLEQVADVYQHGSVVESRLVGGCARRMRSSASDLEGVSGVVGHTGEGEWTVDTRPRSWASRRRSSRARCVFREESERAAELRRAGAHGDAQRVRRPRARPGRRTEAVGTCRSRW